MALALLAAGARWRRRAGRGRSGARRRDRGAALAGPDLFNGTAGRLRFHLCLEAAVPGAGLAAAQRAAEPLLDVVDGIQSLGYAHGIAGIADALLDLYEATGDDRYAAVARHVGRVLAAEALPAEVGVAWPNTRGGAATGPAWCHGAGGIARFLLHLAELDGDPDTLALAERAVAAVDAGRWLSPVACHGLAGSIELLVDAAPALGGQWLDRAHEIGAVLEAAHFEQGGRLVCGSESPRLVTPDLGLGYAGVAAAWLRLVAPERPTLLSVARFAP
ncbi:MAG: lanthionine synthetase LanC family protein [Myxococcota bacterium]